MRWTMRRCDGRWGDAIDDEAMLWGDAMDDEAMRWTMRRCDARWGDAMDDEAMRWSDGNIAPSHRPIAPPHRPSHRLIVHRIASSCTASPHRPSHRLIVHRIASSPSASQCIMDYRMLLCACLTHRHRYTAACAVEKVSYQVKGRNSYNVPIHVLHGTDGQVFIWW